MQDVGCSCKIGHVLCLLPSLGQYVKDKVVMSSYYDYTYTKKHKVCCYLHVSQQLDG